jgi:O-succinylbenzoic acid--CoA ligase
MPELLAVDLCDWVARRARTHLDVVAVECGGEALTYAELEARVAPAAGRLAALGVREGEPVGLLHANANGFAVFAHAITRAGGMLAPHNARLTPGEIAWQLRDAGARFLIADAEHHDAARAAADGDRWLACLPLYHVGGLSIVLRSAIYGTTAVIHERFDEARVVRAVREERVTLLSVVANMLQRMYALDGDPYPSTLRAVLLGGGPAPRPLLEASAARGVPVLQTYGLSETASQVATLSSADALRKLGSAGLPLPGTTVRIEVATGEGESREGDPGEIGEICVAGPTVCAGYLGRPEATAEAIRDGWLHTGDLGYLDDEGYLYVADRRDDLIVSGGENVYPAEVESALLAFPGIEECAVVGVPDERWGALVVAVLVPAAGAPDLADVEAHLRARLAGYKVPRRIEVAAEPLPRTASGKVQRHLVRSRLIEQGGARQ